MSRRISLNCSCFVAQQAGHHPDQNWRASVEAVNAHYRPLETFGPRFEQMVQTVRALGYDALDIWTAGQLNWEWATPAHRQIAARILQQHDMVVTSIGGAFGATREEFLAACQIALDLGTDLLSGTTALLASDRPFVIRVLKDNGLRLGIENHPEKTPADMLAQIGDGADGHIGTTIDTGWWATQGHEVPAAIEALGPHIFHIHLKDVRPPRSVDDHINCGYGDGCVPLAACVQTLQRLGYAGDYSVENHCLDHDPTEELRAALPLVRGWLS